MIEAKEDLGYINIYKTIDNYVIYVGIYLFKFIHITQLFDDYLVLSPQANLELTRGNTQNFT